MLKSFTLLTSGGIDDGLIKIAVKLNQLLFQFIKAVDVCLVNTFEHGHSYLPVNWVEVWAVQKPHIQWHKVWRLYT